MKKSIRKLTVLSIVLACSSAVAMPAEATPPAAEQVFQPLGTTDSGVQLNQTRQYLERQRIAREIAAERQASVIEGTETTGEKPTGTVRFVLQKIIIPKSDVLPQAELTALAKEYEGKEVAIEDLYALVNRINGLYRTRGFVTCRAFLSPQTVHAGIVHIDLVEGKTGSVEISGLTTTRPDYIRKRIHLENGKIQNVKDLNDELLRFNATNDAQLHIELKAGQEAGPTDYVITVREPQKQIAGIFSDNAGSDTSGLYRLGAYWQDRDLTGNRDHLFLSVLRSEGMKAVSSSYNTPINHIGTRAGLSFTSNSVHITDGYFEPLGVRGHAYALTAFVTSPIVTSDTRKSQWGFEYGHQKSKTDYGTSLGLRSHWTDDTIDSLFLYYDQLDFGKSTVFYQKHGYRTGWYTNLNDQTRSFGKYETTMLYQKLFRSGQQWTLRLDGQFASTQYLPSAEMFYLGGMYSVRGYKESLLGGDGGFSASAEYSFPLAKSHSLKGYLFVDGGRVWGSSAFGDRSLMGTGAGLTRDLNDHMSLNVALAFPLIRTINGEEQGRTRIHFSFNSAF